MSRSNISGSIDSLCVRVCVCVCACMRACVRACVRACSHGLNSYGLCSHGLILYGLYSDGLHRYGQIQLKPNIVTAKYSYSHILLWSMRPERTCVRARACNYGPYGYGLYSYGKYSCDLYRYDQI